MNGLYVPVIDPDDDMLSAALKYAEAGWYVLPIRPGSKKAGSVVGYGWPAKSSRDPQHIAAWFAGSSDALALHVGRSGAVVFDVDNPVALPTDLAAALASTDAPHQSTRTDAPGRGHYVFLQPAGRSLGNSKGKLRGGWGEVRGRSGIIVVSPSAHAKAAEGGQYRWLRTGLVPALPDAIAGALPDALDTDDAATDAEVQTFTTLHTEATRRGLLDAKMRSFRDKLDAGESRHEQACGFTAGALKESAAGYYPAAEAVDRIRDMFVTAATTAKPGDPNGDIRTPRQAQEEWAGILAWSVAQAQAADLHEVRKRIDKHVPGGHPLPSHTGDAGGTGMPEPRTAAGALVDLARERYTFGLSDGDEPFAVRRDLPSVAFLLRGGRGSLRAELAAAYLARAGKPAPSQALADALLAMEGLARAGDPQPIALRVAERDGSLWLDLGDATGRAVQVGPAGWQVVEQPPVIFRRTATTGVLPTPARDGNLDRLWSMLTVPPADRSLIAAWLVSLLMPDLAHPILCLLGEQGTGKTTAARLLSATVDPSPAQVRKPPRDADGWVTAATGSWVVALDNLSAIPEWLSDSLCRAATGDGDVRRKLYSDGELVVFAFRRAIIVNGIDLGALRDDLAERLLTLRLDRISPTQRRYESDLDAAWASAHPFVLGGLLDLAAACMRLFPSVRLDSKPRMADFGRVLAAVDKHLGTDGMTRYLGQSAELAADALESDPVLARIAATVTSTFDGTSAELLARITPAGDDWRAPKGWPKDPRALTGLLRRRAPSLRRLGWQVDDLGRTGRLKAVQFRLVPPDDPPSDASGDAGDPPGDSGDSAGDRSLLAGDDGDSAGDRSLLAGDMSVCGVAGDDSGLYLAAGAGDDGVQGLSPICEARKKEERDPGNALSGGAKSEVGIVARDARDAASVQNAAPDYCSNCGGTTSRYGPHGGSLAQPCRATRQPATTALRQAEVVPAGAATKERHNA